MEASSSNMLYSDDDTKNLEQLLHAFGYVVSLQDIASAYCQAGRDLYMAGEILCNMQGSSSGSSTSESKTELDGDSEFRKSHTEVYSSAQQQQQQHYPSAAEAPTYGGVWGGRKPKKCSASMGTVSGVIGAQYARSKPSAHEAFEVKKPLKLISSEFPESEIWEEKAPSDNAEIMQNNVENFLFSMLGNGFQLDRNLIKEVLGACGYNVEKSMEKLLDMSASTLEMGDDLLSVKQLKGKGKETLQCQETSRDRDFAESGEAGSRKGPELPKGRIDRNDLQKEVLQSLFTVPGRLEELPRKIFPRREVKRTRAFGKPVLEPLKDTFTECETPTAKLEAVKYDEDPEDDYEILRKAVKENWITMKEYYKSAAEAYAIGDTGKANKLLEKGHFYGEKAREANDRSSEKLVETRDAEMMSLDLHDHAPKEAIRLLKLHLTSISGIPSIQYLKLIVGINDDKTKEGPRSKRLIKKLLEKESIAWTEEGDGQIMVIRVDEINPKRLSFAKKPSMDSFPLLEK